MDNNLLVSAGSAFALYGTFAALRFSGSVNVTLIHCWLDTDVL